MARGPRIPRPPYVHQEYPKMVWHPDTAENMVANTAAEVPDGWIDHHPNDPHRGDAEPVPQTAPTRVLPDGHVSSDERADIIAKLRRKGIVFSTRAPTAALRELLGEG